MCVTTKYIHTNVYIYFSFNLLYVVFVLPVRYRHIGSFCTKSVKIKTSYEPLDEVDENKLQLLQKTNRSTRSCADLMQICWFMTH